MSSTTPHVIVIGGGASGALLAISILTTKAADVTIIEPREQLARGFAYGEAAPFHLLNVRAANMSAYQNDPNHFIEWLDRNHVVEGVTGEGRFRFTPRSTYGRYLGEQLDALSKPPDKDGRLKHVRATAIGFVRNAGDGISVALAGGSVVKGDVAVIATGYAMKQSRDYAAGIPSWSAISPEKLDGLQNVLILGTGHSAVDHVQLLLAAGYTGRFTMLSRHGFLPAVHHDVEPLHFEVEDIPLGARMSDVWRWFRERAAATERSGGDWRSVLDGLRPHAQLIWQGLSAAEQRRFTRHVRAWYDVRRHRLAPSITSTLQWLRGNHRLEVISGRMLSVSDAGDHAKVVVRRRGQQYEETLQVQGIIECTGFDLDPRSSRNPLLSDLLERGLATAGAQGFGLRVNGSCAVIDTEGHVATDLFAVGPLTRGQFWEVVGLPDIRRQCAEVAQYLLQGAQRPANSTPPNRASDAC